MTTPTTSPRRLHTALLPLAGAALFFCGCAGGKAVQKEGFIGANLCPAPDGILVTKVSADSPAGKAGLRYGDVILGAAKSDLSDPQQRKGFLNRIQTPADKETLLIKRGSDRFKVTLRSQERELLPMVAVVQSLRESLMDAKPMGVAVIVDQVGSVMPQGNAEHEAAWKEAVRKQLETDYEGILLHNFSACDGFRLVDRNEVQKVLQELHFQMTGAVSAELAQQAGQMLGATHILFVGFNRYPPSGPEIRFSDATSLRLIEVKSGSVQATAEWTKDN